MGLYTNEGLIKHAEKALALNTKYMWGGILRSVTENYIKMLSGIPAYKVQYPPSRVNELRSLIGKNYYGVDCVGLIKSYYWSGKADGGTGSPNYGKAGFPDVDANFMYQTAKVKGKITTLPERPGIIVYCKSHPHVGIYIGNGYTIESTLGSRGDGVVKRKLDSFWEYWFECPYIEYIGGTVTGVTNRKYSVAYIAAVRDKPTSKGKMLGKYMPGDTVTIVNGSDTKDSVSGFVYVRISGDKEAWIVKSALI